MTANGDREIFALRMHKDRDGRLLPGLEAEREAAVLHNLR